MKILPLLEDSRKKEKPVLFSQGLDSYNIDICCLQENRIKGLLNIRINTD